MENLKNPVAGHAMIYRNEQLLIVGTDNDRSTCQDVQFVNLEENNTGVYAQGRNSLNRLNRLKMAKISEKH